MKSSTKRITIAVVVFVIVAALIGWQVYHTYDRQYAEDRGRIITNITGAASHLTAYGEEMNYDFSDIANTKDENLQDEMDALRSAAAVYQYDIQWGYSDGFWDAYPNSTAYLQTLTDYCLAGDFSDYQQLVGMTQPLTDLAKVNISSSSDLKNFYSDLEKSLDGFSSTGSTPSGSQ